MATVEIDSSGELPPDAPSGPRLESVATVEQRARLLASKSIRATALAVARRRGVSAQDLEDVAQETLLEAMSAALPADADQARRYVGKVASRVAARHLARLRSGAQAYVESEEGDAAAEVVAAAQPAAFEEREVVRKIVDHGIARSPRWFPLFLRARALGESAEEIAQELERSPGLVRRAWWDLQRELGDYRRRLGLAAGMLILLAMGLAAWRGARQPFDFEAMAPYRVRRAEPPGPDAVDVKARAADAFRRQQWAACADDAAAAMAMDPSLDTPQFRYMRDVAEHQRLVRSHGPEPKWGPDPKRGPKNQ